MRPFPSCRGGSDAARPTGEATIGDVLGLIEEELIDQGIAEIGPRTLALRSAILLADAADSGSTGLGASETRPSPGLLDRRGADALEGHDLVTDAIRLFVSPGRAWGFAIAGKDEEDVSLLERSLVGATSRLGETCIRYEHEP